MDLRMFEDFVVHMLMMKMMSDEATLLLNMRERPFYFVVVVVVVAVSTMIGSGRTRRLWPSLMRFGP